MSELLIPRVSTRPEVVGRLAIGTDEMPPLAASSQELPVARLEPSIGPDRWSASQRAIVARVAALFVPLGVITLAWPNDLVIAIASACGLATIVAVAALSNR